MKNGSHFLPAIGDFAELCAVGLIVKKKKNLDTLDVGTKPTSIDGS